jgi:hypothetical protein
MLALNCNATKMSIIDINGVLSFYDLSVRGSGATQGEHLSFERKVCSTCGCTVHRRGARHAASITSLL